MKEALSPKRQRPSVVASPVNTNPRIDYHAFGMQIEEYSFTPQDGGYRYGFQGQEQDGELFQGSAVSFKYRIHDARLGRFLSLDPLAPEYPWNSPCAFSENRLIDGIELEGLEYFPVTGLTGEQMSGNTVSQNDDGTYNLIIGADLQGNGGLEFNNVELITIDGAEYFDIGEHLYFNTSDGWTSSGNESDRVTQWPNRPDFNLMWNNYPGDNVATEDVWKDIGGKVYFNHKNSPNSFYNSCALRTCKSLNYSGATVNPTADEKNRGRAGSGADKNWYYYGVNELGEYLNRTYDNPDFFFNVTTSMTASDIRNQLTGRQGIIVFQVSGWSDASGHFTLWDGSDVGYGDYFDSANLHGATLVSVSLWLLD